MLHLRKLFDIDFFVPGYVNKKYYQAEPRSLQQLQSTAKDAIRNVNENMLTAVIANFCKRVDACIQEKWVHFENVINSK